MFKCDKCGQDSKPGEKQYKIVIERASPNHPGKEIEKELKFCKNCKEAICPNLVKNVVEQDLKQ